MSSQKLKIAFNQENVGELIFDTDKDTIEVKYTESWKKQGFPLSPHIPLDGEANTVTIRRFLENLFPEGEALEELLESFRIGKRNIFRITQLIGKDATGALGFRTESELIEETKFRAISEEELAQRLTERATKGLIMWDGKARLSIAGVQDKLPVTILSDGRIGLGEGDIASTHILKFQKEDGKVPYLVLNEYFCMSLAREIGLNVAPVKYRKFGRHPALLVQRFDRELKSDVSVKRRHIIDGCQALNLPPTYKYEKNMGPGESVAHIRDGVSLPKLFAFCMQTQNPAVSVFSLLKWTLFNLCISNSDAHGKNISFFVFSERKQFDLCPWYDLVNIAIYPDLDNELAMAIGDEFDPNEVYGYQLLEFCGACNIQPRLLKSELDKLIATITEKLHLLVIPELCTSAVEKDFWQQLIIHTQKRCDHFKQVIPDLLKMKLK